MHADVGTALAILGLALAVDTLVGEYPACLHPVVWFGKLTDMLLKLAPLAGWWRQFLFGAVLTVALVALSAGAAWFVLWLCPTSVSEVLVGAYLFKASFALSEL